MNAEAGYGDVSDETQGAVPCDSGASGFSRYKLFVEQARLLRRPAAGSQRRHANHADGPAHWYSQHIPHAQTCMRLVGRLAVDTDKPLSDEFRTVGPLTHEAGTPQPLVEALPVTTLLLRDDVLLSV